VKEKKEELPEKVQTTLQNQRIVAANQLTVIRTLRVT
jgi:hypothetical protein